jgi:hypothetical protein
VATDSTVAQTAAVATDGAAIDNPETNILTLGRWMTDSWPSDNWQTDSSPIADRAIASVHSPPHVDRMAQAKGWLFWPVQTTFFLLTTIYAIDPSYGHDENEGDRGHSSALSAFPEPRLAARCHREVSDLDAKETLISYRLAEHHLPTHRGAVLEPCSIFRGHS